jgi:hypothetical protein
VDDTGVARGIKGAMDIAPTLVIIFLLGLRVRVTKAVLIFSTFLRLSIKIITPLII